MGQRILCTLKVELGGRCSDVTLFEPISFKRPIDAADKHIVTNIKFSLIVQHWVFNILLKYKSSKLTVTIFLPAFEPDYDIIKTITNCYSIASICVLTWFNNPNISNCLSLFFLCLKMVVVS